MIEIKDKQIAINGKLDELIVDTLSIVLKTYNLIKTSSSENSAKLYIEALKIAFNTYSEDVDNIVEKLEKEDEVDNEKNYN